MALSDDRWCPLLDARAANRNTNAGSESPQFRPEYVVRQPHGWLSLRSPGLPARIRGPLSSPRHARRWRDVASARAAAPGHVWRAAVRECTDGICEEREGRLRDDGRWPHLGP